MNYVSLTIFFLINSHAAVLHNRLFQISPLCVHNSATKWMAEPYQDTLLVAFLFLFMRTVKIQTCGPCAISRETGV